MAHHRPCTARMARTFLDAPELLALARLVTIDRLRSLADEGELAINRRHVRSGKCLAPVAISFGFAVGAEVFVVDGTLLLPDGLSGLLIERDDELMIASVKVHDEQITEKDGR